MKERSNLKPAKPELGIVVDFSSNPNEEIAK